MVDVYQPVTEDPANYKPKTSMYSDVVPVTITQLNTWTDVISTAIQNPFDAEVYSQSNLDKVIIDVRVLSNIVQIRSNKLTTYNVHIEGN